MLSASAELQVCHNKSLLLPEDQSLEKLSALSA